MKIKQISKPFELKTFNKGDVFKYRNVYYLRVDAGKYNAVDLATGDMMFFWWWRRCSVGD